MRLKSWGAAAGCRDQSQDPDALEGTPLPFICLKGTLEGTLSHLFIHCVLSTIKESSRSTAAAEGGACLR